MSKNNHFSGQPIFSQIISLIPRGKIGTVVQAYSSDRYCKKFTTYNHLVTMLYCIFSKCHSIREVSTGLLACGNKLNHLGIHYSVRKSTLSDANSRRCATVFEEIYKVLHKQYAPFLSDSLTESWAKRLYLVDSTTISLFQEILKNAGRNPVNGKRKGGIKVHTLVKAEEDVPCLVKFTPASAHDTPFIKDMNLPEGSIVVFDKGYNDYQTFLNWTNQKISFVTRLRSKAVYEVLECRAISDLQRIKGIRGDKTVILGHHHHNKGTRLKVRLITYFDESTKREFTFLSNNFKLSAYTIAQIYKRRWQIEILFKRLKQNYPVKYFLGDNENAIKIQIWCALIADFLLTLVKQQSRKRRWSFSNLASMVRLHLMNYINLKAFLHDPEKAIRHELKLNYGRSLYLFPT